MTAQLVLSNAAKNVLQRLPPETRRRVKAALAQLESDPTGRKHDLDVRQLMTPPGSPAMYRVAVGAFRIAFLTAGRTVRVVRIFHRSFGNSWLD